jgi:hypothetical protein
MSRRSDTGSLFSSVAETRQQSMTWVKRKKSSPLRAVATLLAGAALSVSTPAAAIPACSSYPNPVYISGPSGPKPLLQALATTLANDGVPVSIIYSSPESCLGVGDLISSQASTESTVSPVYLAPGGTTAVCALNSGAPQPVDIAVSDVFPATCATDVGLTIPSTVVDVQGPIQAMTFAVPGGPAGSSANAISAAAAYVVFGYDADIYSVSPWTQAADIFVRDSTSGTLAMLGAAIGLAPSKWVNAATGSASPNQESSAPKMELAIADVTSQQSATIGILSTEGVVSWNAVPANSSTPIKILAYQQGPSAGAPGTASQSCGYLPSSSQSALDEINVRMGQYAIWGPLHFLINTSSGQPTGPDAAAVATVLNYFVATGPNPGTAPFNGAIGGDAGPQVSNADIQAVITAEAKPGYFVPWCAMLAQRTSELGPEASYSSPEPCSCLFEETLGSAVPGHTCTTCSSSGQCPSTAPACRYGYCEVQ